MKYAVVIYEKPEDFESRNDPNRSAAYWGAYMAYAQALQEAGIAAGGTALQPPTTGTSLRIRNGSTQIQDGPFPDSKEQLGGLMIVDVPDLDTALKWAARCPAASNGFVEVRPVLPPMPKPTSDKS